MNVRNALSVLLFAAILGSTAFRPQSAPPAADLVERIQSRYSTIRDFTADFTLTATSGLMAKSAVDRGKAMVKKPGRMHWIMETGSKSEVVADGTMVYSYLPQDQTVYRRALSDQSSSALLLLTGRGDLVRDFVASLPADQPSGEWHVTLAPRAGRDDFKTLTLIVDRTSLQLRGMTIVDDQGGTQRYRLANIKENQGLPDSAFEFKMPKGVVVR